MAWFAATLASFASETGSVQLTHAKTGFVVLEFDGGKTLFYDRFLEAEMRQEGIPIPEALRKEYDQALVVFPQNPLFPKAFIEIYFPRSFPSSDYRWEEKAPKQF